MFGIWEENWMHFPNCKKIVLAGDAKVFFSTEFIKTSQHKRTPNYPQFDYLPVPAYCLANFCTCCLKSKLTFSIFVLDRVSNFFDLWKKLFWLLYYWVWKWWWWWLLKDFLKMFLPRNGVKNSRNERRCRPSAPAAQTTNKTLTCPKLVTPPSALPTPTHFKTESFGE